MATTNVTTDGDDDHQRDIGRLPTEDDVSLAPLARLSSDDEDEDDDVGGATEGDDAWDAFTSLVSGLNLNDDDKDEGSIGGQPLSPTVWSNDPDEVEAQLAASLYAEDLEDLLSLVDDGVGAFEGDDGLHDDVLDPLPDGKDESHHDTRHLDPLESSMSRLNLDDDDKDEGSIGGQPWSPKVWINDPDEVEAQLAASLDTEDLEDLLSPVRSEEEIGTEGSIGGGTLSPLPLAGSLGEQDFNVEDFENLFADLQGCLLLYRAHGIEIDSSGDLKEPPKYVDEAALSKLKKVERPAVKDRWSIEEDLTLLQAVQLMGKRWVELGQRLIPNRTGAALRERYRVLERRIKKAVRLEKQEHESANRAVGHYHPAVGWYFQYGTPARPYWQHSPFQGRYPMASHPMPPPPYQYGWPILPITDPSPLPRAGRAPPHGAVNRPHAPSQPSMAATRFVLDACDSRTGLERTTILHETTNDRSQMSSTTDAV